MPAPLSKLSRVKLGAIARGQDGFALVIALGLMAFILLLMLSLSTFIQVELRSAATQKEMLLARQNALLALHIGLGELQRHAGPDQRVTASASLLDTDRNTATVEGVAHPRWIGAWNSDASLLGRKDTLSPASPDAWLVSAPVDADGNRPGPLDEYTGPAVVMQEPRDPDGLDSETLAALRVRAPLLPIEAGSNGPAGGFAWWADDEGLKARVNLPPGTGTAPRSSPLRYQAPDSPDFSFPFPQVNWASEAARLYRERSVSFSQFEGLLAPSLDIDTASPHLTLWSMGVHSDVAKGGLKQDLSAAFEMPLDDFEQANPFTLGGAYSWELTSSGLDHPVNLVFNETLDRTRFPLSYGTWLARAPTWHLLRNHYRLHKAEDADRNRLYNNPPPLTGHESSPSIPIRMATPGYWDGTRFFAHPRLSTRQPGPDPGRLNAGNMAAEPHWTSPSVLPVFHRVQRIFSLHAVERSTDTNGNPEYELQIHRDHVISFWNPYDVALELNRISLRYNFTSQSVDLEVVDSDGGTRTRRGHVSSAMRAIHDPGGWHTRFGAFGIVNIHLINPDNQPIRFEPGEVLVFGDYQPQLDHNDNRYYYPGINLSDKIGTDRGYFPDGPPPAENQPPPPLLVRQGDETRLSFYYDPHSPHGIEDIFEVILRPLVGGGNMWSTDFWPTFISIKPMWGNLVSDEDYHRFFVGDPPQPPLLSTTTRVYSYEEIAAIANRSPGDPNDPFKEIITQYDIYRAPEDDPFPESMGGQTNPRAVGILRPADANATRYPGYPIVSTLRNVLREHYSWDEPEMVAVDGHRGFYGLSVNHPSSVSGASPTVFFEVPTAPLLSLASLRHVDTGYLTDDPSLTIGNSLPHPWIPADDTMRYIYFDRRSQSSYQNHGHTYNDMSFLLNEALFDRHFFSGLAPASQGEDISDTVDNFLAGGSLLNPRHKLWHGGQTVESMRASLLSEDGALTPEAFLRLPSLLFNAGAFNINSTSIEAWTAHLTATLGEDLRRRNYSNQPANWNSNNKVAFPGQSFPLGGEDDAWAGFRTLDQTEIEQLAEAIIHEVKRRGPFKSLADFVNRRLVASDDPEADTGLGGVIHTAIHTAGLNEGKSRYIEEQHTIEEPLSRFHQEQHRHGPIAFASPQVLTQADVLTPLGPSLSARSDTFRIRFYGETRSLIRNTPTRAWGEAVVQRIPDYVDADANEAYTPTDPDQADHYDLPELNAINQQFGRRFVIVDIRWLAPEEI